MTHDPADPGLIIEANRNFETTRTLELWIPGPLPGLNDFMWQAGYHETGSIKKGWSRKIGDYAAFQGFRPIKSGVFNYVVREPSRRRDPSNFCGGAVKVIEDALQKCGMLAGDGWQHVKGLYVSWELAAARPGVYLVVEDCELWEEANGKNQDDSGNRIRQGTARNSAHAKASRGPFARGAAARALSPAKRSGRGRSSG